ncbi:response regulator [Litorivivens sp.]|uniref:response regulator n=1 Tax=Litorivivens sp. TaxID=2020868 RepID=UPI0035644F9D
MYRLMIVDDSNVIRRKVARCQNDDRFQVVGTACNGRKAMEGVAVWQPDVVTMDLTMPEMDGLECIQALMGFNPDLRILVVSALKDKATGIEALQLGARGFLCKPFTEQQLSAALEELMED